jgi:hypothetical protein
MTFDKVDTMTYQPRRNDNDRGQRPRWLSLFGLTNIVSSDIKSQQIFLFNDLSSIIYQHICVTEVLDEFRYYLCSGGKLANLN